MPNRMEWMTVAVAAAFVAPVAAVRVAIGRSTEPYKTVSIRDALPPGVTSCHDYPANECCGHLFIHTLDTNRGTLTINRTDHIAGWTEELAWECATRAQPEMHLPVGFHLVPGGANCHELRNPLEIWQRAQFDSDDWTWTTQINMRIFCTWDDNVACDHMEYNPAPQRFRSFLGLRFGTNWHGAWKTYLRIEQGGTYTFAKQIGYAESAIAFINQQEMFRSRCREPFISTTMDLDPGVYSIAIYQMDDGWEDALVFMYSGPDTGRQLITVPSEKFQKPCAPNEWADPQQNYACVRRPAPYNQNSRSCNAVNGRPHIVSTRPDQNCVPCENADDHIHRCVNGVHAPLTTPFNGRWFSRGTETPPATAAPPECNGCGYRIKACAAPTNNTWDIDYIQFRVNNTGVDMSHHEAEPISSGWDMGGDNHDYHPLSYAPLQAFRSNFNLWRGKADDDGNYFIGIRSDQVISVDSVQFASGRCSDRSELWWANFNARRVAGGRAPYRHNITQCVAFEKWNGQAWQELGRRNNVQACSLVTITATDRNQVVQCPGTTDGTLGNGVCNPQLDTQSCNFDLGDCRRCTDPLPAIENGGYRFLNASDRTNSTLGMVAEVYCNQGYQVDTVDYRAVCNGSRADFTEQATWQFRSGELAAHGSIPRCGPLRCLPNASVASTLETRVALRNTTSMDSLLVGESARFACDSHYEMTGHAAIRCIQMGDGGVLEHDLPMCTRLTCDADALAVPENGQIVSIDSNSGGNGLHFACDPGYELVGEDVVTCVGEAWTAEAPTCQIRQCPDVPVNGGQLTYASNVFGSSASVTCDAGKRPSTSDSATCDVAHVVDSVEWRNVPTCVDITCDIIDQITGEIRPAPSRLGTILYNQTVTYTCDNGYAFDDGAATRTLTCGVDDFQNPPICSAVPCRTPYIASPNMTLSNSADAYYVDDQIILGCVEGYEPRTSRESSFRCVAGIGAAVRWTPWEPSIQCRFIRYPPAPTFRYATMDIGSRNAQQQENLYPGTVMSPGFEIRYNCNYEGGTIMTYVLTEDRTWVAGTGSCPERSTTTTVASDAGGGGGGSPDGSTGEDNSSSSSTTIIAVAVIALLLIIAAIAGAFVIVKKSKAAANAREASFENPMYDSTDIDHSGGNFGSGYMDVAGNQGVGSGYMDVAPSNDTYDDPSVYNGEDDGDI